MSRFCANWPPARSSHLQHDQGPVIRQRRTLRKPIHLAQNQVSHLGGPGFMLLLDEQAQLLGSEKLPLTVTGLRDPVRMKNQNITRVQRHAPLVVADFLKNSEWKSRERNLVAPPVLIEQRLRLPRVRHAQLASAPLPRGETRGHEAPLDAPLADDLVHLLEHFRWLKFLRSQTPHNADS